MYRCTLFSTWVGLICCAVLRSVLRYFVSCSFFVVAGLVMILSGFVCGCLSVWLLVCLRVCVDLLALVCGGVCVIVCFTVIVRARFCKFMSLCVGSAFGWFVGSLFCSLVVWVCNVL